MKYAKFSDDFLSDFRLDDNGETLVLTDKRGCTRAVRLLPYEDRPQGEWIVTAEDNEGIHRIQCPFCRYEKGSDFIDYIIVTFEKFPPFCESCGAELRGAE